MTMDENDENLELDSEPYKIPLGERKVYTQASDPPIKDLCDRLNKGKLESQSDFQRNYVWEKKAELRSKLIESVLLKVPIPVIYTAELDSGNEVVVDGQQRLRTLLDFCKKDGFKLSKLKILEDLNGKGYSELPEQLQDAIDSYPLRVIRIEKESHPDIKFDIFERLNRGSVKLNDQELRNCIYRGNFNELLKKLVQNKDFLSIQNLSEPEKRMKDIERILRFFALSDKGIQNYKSPLRTFLSLYMEEKRVIQENEKNEKTELFKKCAELVRTVFGDFAGHRWVKDETGSGGYLATNFNDGILDAQMIGFLEYHKRDVVPRAQIIKDAYIDLVTTLQFAETVEIATYSTKAVKKRLELWLSKLREVIGYPLDDRRFYSTEEKLRLFSRQDGNICAICKNQIMDIDDAHVDHIDRFSEGGKTEIKNAQITHRYCNLEKN